MIFSQERPLFSVCNLHILSNLLQTDSQYIEYTWNSELFLNCHVQPLLNSCFYLKTWSTKDLGKSLALPLQSVSVRLSCPEELSDMERIEACARMRMVEKEQQQRDER